MPKRKARTTLQNGTPSPARTLGRLACGKPRKNPEAVPDAHMAAARSAKEDGSKTEPEKENGT